MTATVPAWAEPLDSSLSVADLSGDASEEHRTVVLVDAALLREHDPAWLRDVESTLGSVVAICSDPTEAQWARANGARGVAPASILHAQADVALDVLADIVTTSTDSKTRLERFMCDAIHEFRTPLTVISEFAGLFEDGIGGALTERQQTYIGYIQSAVYRMGEQFDDYRDGLRMRLGTLQHEASSDSVTAVVAGASTSMDAIFIGSEGLGSLCLDGVDGKRLTEAVKRLIAGAQKLSAKGQQVDVELVQPASSTEGRPSVEIHVRYRGVVLSEEDVVVMDEGTVMRSNGFYRSVARVFGLGVSMARLFVSQSGGSTRLELAEGIGGTFVAELPIKVAVASDRMAATSEAA